MPGAEDISRCDHCHHYRLCVLSPAGLRAPAHTPGPGLCLGPWGEAASLPPSTAPSRGRGGEDPASPTRFKTCPAPALCSPGVSPPRVGDEGRAAGGAEVCGRARAVGALPAGPLLRAVVPVPARLRAVGALPRAGAAHGLPRAAPDGEPQSGAARRGGRQGPAPGVGWGAGAAAGAAAGRLRETRAGRPMGSWAQAPESAGSPQHPQDEQGPEGGRGGRGGGWF